MVSQFGGDFNAKTPKIQEKTLQPPIFFGTIFKKVVYMNKKQERIQDLQQEKQEALRKSKIYKNVSIVANCSTGVAAAFILIGAINNDTEMAMGAFALCMLLATNSAAVTYDRKKYTDLAPKIQRKINRIQGRHR